MAKRLLCLLFCVFIAFSCLGCAAQGADTLAARGVLDLSGWDFQKQGRLRLDGDWAFYWEQFLDPSSPSPTEPDAYSAVPGVWNQTVIDGEHVSGIGFATYRLLVKTDLPKGTQLGIRLFTLSSAYRLYVGEALVAKSGVPSQYAETETGEYRPQTVYFQIPDGEFTITLHVSNHMYARGGFWYSAFLGTAHSIAALHDGIMQRETLLFGAILIALLFFFSAYLLRRSLRYLLYFSLFCIPLLVTLGMAGQIAFFPLPFKTVILLWHSSEIWMFFFLFLFMHRLYKSKLSGLLLRISLAATALQQLVYLLVPVQLYTISFIYLASVTNVLSVAGMIFVILQGMANEHSRLGGWLNLSGIFVAALSYVHDVLYWKNIINSSYGELHYFGLMFFLLLQMIMQAARIRQYFDQSVASELAFLQAQIKPHFLYNVLNTVIAMSHEDAEKSRKLLTAFSGYLRHNFDFRDTSQLVPLSNEIEFAKAYISIEQARFGERVAVRFDVDANITAKVPTLLLQPLLENAIHHGLLKKREGGSVEVSIVQQGAQIRFSVTDDGGGMEQEEIASALVSNRSGEGVALHNIHKRLLRLYDKGLEITSSKGEGTRVCWSVPVRKKGGTA